MDLISVPAGPEKQYTHILSHQKIEASFWRFEIKSEVLDNSLYLKVPKTELGALAIPRLVQKYLEDISML
jgi:hypothetical protein